MRRVGASNAEIAERMSVSIDQHLEAPNKAQGESLFNPAKTGAIAERKRKWKEIDDYATGNDGLNGKPINDGRKGAGLAELAWKNNVGNCAESANVALETLQRARIRARIFNSSTGGAHDLVVIALAPNADPNDPMIWGDGARVVDGWIGHSSSINIMGEYGSKALSARNGILESFSSDDGRTREIERERLNDRSLSPLHVWTFEKFVRQIVLFILFVHDAGKV